MIYLTSSLLLAYSRKRFVRSFSLSAATTTTSVTSGGNTPPQKELFPYQEEGVKRLVTDKRLLLADEMGLGKTIQCIAALNNLLKSNGGRNDKDADDGGIKVDTGRVLVICPKSVLGVWQDELSRWLDDYPSMTVTTATPKTGVGVDRPGVTLINYDICRKFRKELQAKPFDVLICDEAHYLKTLSSQRTQVIFGDDADDAGIGSTYLWLLTGTPMMNRPVELFPLLRALRPKEFNSFESFTNRYCDPKTKRVGRGRYIKDLTGASNLQELANRLEPTMLRRYKADVLSQLPPKFRSCLCLTTEEDIGSIERMRMQELLGLKVDEDDENAASGANEIVDLEAFSQGSEAGNSIIEEYLGGKIDEEAVSRNQMMGYLATIRRETAERKLQPAVEVLKDIIDTQKVVVFCHHRKLIEDLVEAFGDQAVHVMGGMDNDQRSEAVRRFQSDDSVRVFVGSIRAAGFGLTLTAASRVVFLELDWSPAIMSQAEDRCHRVGQTSSVNIQYFVFKDTIDEWIARINVNKQQNIDQVLIHDVSAESKNPTNYSFDFGKHKGVRMQDVPRGYLSFLARTPDIWHSRPDLWKALHAIGMVPEFDEDEVEDDDEISRIVNAKDFSIEALPPANEHLAINAPGGMLLGRESVARNARESSMRSPKSSITRPPPMSVTTRPTSTTTASSTRPPPASTRAGKGVNYVFDFGKHRGSSWNDIPKSYQKWILQEEVWKNRENMKHALVEAGVINLGQP